MLTNIRSYFTGATLTSIKPVNQTQITGKTEAESYREGSKKHGRLFVFKYESLDISRDRICSIDDGRFGWFLHIL
jgi:hypothetical protein